MKNVYYKWPLAHPAHQHLYAIYGLISNHSVNAIGAADGLCMNASKS